MKVSTCIALCLFQIFFANSVPAGITDFSEDFTDGTFDEKLLVRSNGEFVEDGFFVSLIAEPAFRQGAIFEAKISGSGNFTTSVDVKDLNLGNVPAGIALFEYGSSFQIVVGGTAPTTDLPSGFTFSLFENGDVVPDGTYGLRMSSRWHSEYEFVDPPPTGATTRFQTTYDDTAKRITYFYDPDIADQEPPLSFGPFVYPGFVDERIAQIGFHVSSGTVLADVRAEGILQQFSVLSAVDPSFGDMNDDGMLDIADLDLLTAAVLSGNSDSKFDLNGDSVISEADRTFWIHDVKKTYYGDSDLDGQFSSSDLVAVFQAAAYEDDVEGNSTWATGDWNGDTEFTSRDLVVAFQDGGYERGIRPVAVVPEPPPINAVALCAICWILKRKWDK